MSSVQSAARPLVSSGAQLAWPLETAVQVSSMPAVAAHPNPKARNEQRSKQQQANHTHPWSQAAASRLTAQDCPSARRLLSQAILLLSGPILSWMRLVVLRTKNNRPESGGRGWQKVACKHDCSPLLTARFSCQFAINAPRDAPFRRRPKIACQIPNRSRAPTGREAAKQRTVQKEAVCSLEDSPVLRRSLE